MSDNAFALTLIIFFFSLVALGLRSIYVDKRAFDNLEYEAKYCPDLIKIQSSYCIAD